MQPNKVPFLYNFSPSVVAPPLDYSDWIRITGYWFLDEGPGYEPPAEIVAFIKKARADRKKIVYIGFGSILVEDPAAMTKTVVDAVMKADVRCILAKGWSNRVAGSAPTKAEPTPVEIPLPPEIFQVQSVPHDWLFPQMDAVAHHGGSGTTGASIRSGVPTIAKPFFGDQFFFGARLEDLGVGLCLKKLNSTVFARALWEATHSERMIARAKILGEQVRSVSFLSQRAINSCFLTQIQQENGVGNAINCIYRDLEYARSLIKRHDRREDLPEDIEEHWTFVDAESGSEISRSMISNDFDAVQHSSPGVRIEKRS
jgi:sterol 3beta-glucosyltransferase